VEETPSRLISSALEPARLTKWVPINGCADIIELIHPKNLGSMIIMLHAYIERASSFVGHAEFRRLPALDEDSTSASCAGRRAGDRSQVKLIRVVLCDHCNRSSGIDEPFLALVNEPSELLAPGASN
jgi:hypothetical protein